MSEITRNITQRARILGLEFTDTALELIESLIIEAEDAGIEQGAELGYDDGYSVGYDAGEQHQQDRQDEVINYLENDLENAKLEISELEDKVADRDAEIASLEALVRELQS